MASSPRRLPLFFTGPNAIAAADQQHAMIRAEVDKLTADARSYIIGRKYDPNDVGVWAMTGLSGTLEAALRLAGNDPDRITTVLVGMVAESVLRLAQQPPDSPIAP